MIAQGHGHRCTQQMREWTKSVDECWIAWECCRLGCHAGPVLRPVQHTNHLSITPLVQKLFMKPWLHDETARGWMHKHIVNKYCLTCDRCLLSSRCIQVKKTENLLQMSLKLQLTGIMLTMWVKYYLLMWLTVLFLWTVHMENPLKKFINVALLKWAGCWLVRKVQWF